MIHLNVNKYIDTVFILKHLNRLRLFKEIKFHFWKMHEGMLRQHTSQRFLKYSWREALQFILLCMYFQNWNLFSILTFYFHFRRNSQSLQ